MGEFLKCDADGCCNHREDVAEITADMVGKPCPKCGANLLTHGDFEVYVAVFRPMMAAMHEAGLSRPATATDMAEAKNLMSLNYHEGELRVRFPKPAA
jgi:hypothetical protein